jgi:hypothetical protein
VDGRYGLSNPEVGAQLYVSARTAHYHLKKVSSNWASNRATSSGVSSPLSRSCRHADSPVALCGWRMWVAPQAADDETSKWSATRGLVRAAENLIALINSKGMCNYDQTITCQMVTKTP